MTSLLASALVEDPRGCALLRQVIAAPEAGRSISAVRRPSEQHPLTIILVAGAFGYVLAYLLHGGGSRWGQEDGPDYARTRDCDRRSR
jgi:hypothetical protein